MKKLLLVGLVALAALGGGGWLVVETGARPVAPAATPLPNDLGWRLGTEWTIRVEHYASYLAEPEWVAGEYRFTVVRADSTAKRFTVRMRFADAEAQPGRARDDLLRAEYGVRNGARQLSSLQLDGKGPKLPARVAKGFLGESFVSLELPERPFEGGQSVGADVPELGRRQANKVRLGEHETATLAKGAPWWVSYSKGDRLRGELTSFSK